MNNKEKNNNKKTSTDTQTQTKENIFLQALNYYEGKGVKQDYTKAFHYFELALKQGYLESQYYLAICHEIGLGTKSDKKKSLEYYYRAAIQNNDKAQLFIANYYNQQNSSETKKKAIYWYELSSKCGNKEASQMLELLCSKNDNSKEKIERKQKTQKPSAKKTTTKTAVKTTATENASSQNPYTTCYLKATCENDAKAQYELALLFQSGKYIQKNEKQAFCFFEKSANQNYIPAKIELAKCYTIGRGTEKNLKKAFDLYQIAANAGNAEAQNILGNYYINGNAGGLKIPKDIGKALEWWTKAAKQGLTQAKNSLNTYDRKKDIFRWYTLERKEYYLAPATKNNLFDALDMLDNFHLMDKCFFDFEDCNQISNQIFIIYKGDLRDILNFQVHIQINEIGESVYYILLKINVYFASRIFGTTYDSFSYDETYKDQNHFYEYQTSDRKKVEYILSNFIEKEELPPYTKSPWYDRKLLPSINLKRPLPALPTAIFSCFDRKLLPSINLKQPLPAVIFTCFDNFKFHYDEAYKNLLEQQSSSFVSDHLDSLKSASSCAANPMGVYITWMIKADLLSSVQRETHKKAIEEVLKNQLSGLDFILNYCGGMLTSEDFNELGTAFTKYYYPKYLNDYFDYSKQKYHAVYISTNTYLDFKGLELKIDNAFSYFINSLS